MGNLSGWTEGILLTLAFLTISGIIFSAMNVQYGTNHNLGLTDDSNATQLFINYQDTAVEQITGGEVDFDAQNGITLKSSYGLAKDAISIAWTFITGGFIENLAQAWNVGQGGLVFARILRVIYFLSLVFALLFALFKVKL